MASIPTEFSIRHPWLIITLTIVISLLFLTQFPKINFDTHPENMLSTQEPVRVFHHKGRKLFKLYDVLIVDIVNESHPDGVLNMGTLNRVYRLTEELLNLKRGKR